MRILFFKDCRVVTALSSLVYLLPDTRHVPQPNNLLSFVPVSHTLCITHKTKLMFLFSFVSKENADIKAAALDLQIPQPVVTVRGNVTEPKDAFLVIEKVVVCHAAANSQHPNCIAGVVLRSQHGVHSRVFQHIPIHGGVLPRHTGTIQEDKDQ